MIHCTARIQFVLQQAGDALADRQPQAQFRTLLDKMPKSSYRTYLEGVLADGVA